MNLKLDEFEVLRKINNKKKITQRGLANSLGFSLGKLNYCIKGLVDKGFIKFENFKYNKNKLKYVYILTPKGMYEKLDKTILFMKLKMKEYDKLKKEIKEVKSLIKKN